MKPRLKPTGQAQRTERWRSQKWIFDNAISVIGVEPFTGGSITRAYEAISIDTIDLANELKSRVRKVSDISRECRRIALLRETRAKEAESQNHLVTARENYFITSLMYGCARWPIWDDDDPNLIELTEKITDCYVKYSALSDHSIQRVEIPFEGGNLYGYFHLPIGIEETKTSSSLPCVVVLPGMDTFKEELVRLYGDRFLQRGFSVFVVDGPGQGETLARGMKLTKDNFDRAGKAIMDTVLRFKSPEVDKNKVGMFAASFGSYLGPRIMAYDNRYRCGAFSNICHEPKMKTIFNGTLPSFKARHMWMTGIYDEEEFDNSYCSVLTLEGVGPKISQPIYIAAGSDDPLSPIEYTYDFFNSVASQRKTLMVYEGEEHRISDPMLSERIGDFVKDAMENRETANGAYILERGRGWNNALPIDLGQDLKK